MAQQRRARAAQRHVLRDNCAGSGAVRLGSSPLPERGSADPVSAQRDTVAAVEHDRQNLCDESAECAMATVAIVRSAIGGMEMDQSLCFKRAEQQSVPCGV
eukprot:CAMPEP_0183364080 /NCGR_PEP_ID=MMETSP0164_2-20130417/78187_1 /TAXON_ID=221442 /ORGANISM="Coccolithus pelagicus ssp braarudi, Strain PLY182g" /LENGTH=100 /DNA_ID=CAMNT_0025539309 /DNA_START=63 /DNA_END=365 /DNA_ORIENTATION=-